MVKKGLVVVLLFLISLNIVFARQTVIISQGNQFRVDLLRVDPSPLTPGGSSDIWFEVFNLDDKPLYDAQIKLSAPFPFSIENNMLTVGEIDSGQSSKIKFNIGTNKNAKQGNYNFTLYLYSADSDSYVTSTFQVNVANTGKILTPVSVAIEPEEINPGDKGIINVNFMNTADSELKDIAIKFDLKNDSIPIAPLGSTAEKKIKSLPQGDKSTVSFNIIVSPSAEAKVYKIPLKITYFDDLGNLVSTEDTVGVVINGNPEFRINLEETDIYGKGDRGKITISISNIAPVDVKFVNMELLESQNYQIISPRSIYIGNLESDDFDTAEYDIYVKKTEDEKVPLNVLIKYMDSYNNEKEYSTTVSLQTYSYFKKLKYGIKSSKGITNTIIVILVLLFLYFFYKNWKKTKNIKNAFTSTLLSPINFFRSSYKK